MAKRKSHASGPRAAAAPDCSGGDEAQRGAFGPGLVEDPHRELAATPAAGAYPGLAGEAVERVDATVRGLADRAIGDAMADADIHGASRETGLTVIPMQMRMIVK